MATTELRRADDGRIWAHRIKKNGGVSQAGSVVSAESAEEMIENGEARWYAEPQPRQSGRRLSYEQAVQTDADAGQPIGIAHWSAVMNRDD